MATIYVGSASAGANDGTSWVNRYGSLTAAEDKPVAAGDFVWVGAGAYRETLTCDVSGSSGDPITFAADLTGEHTDGVGGVVRITGTDNDTTAARANCITAAARTYRTFRGFTLDTVSGVVINATSSPGNWIVEDCVFQNAVSNTNVIVFSGTGTNNTVRRCRFLGHHVGGYAVQFTHSTTVNDAAHLVENCLFATGQGRGVVFDRVGGGAVKGCTFHGSDFGVRVQTALAVGQTINVNNCLLVFCSAALQGTTSGEITEDYNTFYGNSADRTNTATGANSVTYPPLYEAGLLLSGFRFPWTFGELSQWSQVRRLSGSNMSSDDLSGMTRPTTDSKKSWGAVQFADVSREATDVRSGCAALELADAGRRQFIVPSGASALTVSVYVARSSSYAGTACPQMVVRQPGQSASTYTDTGAASAWNQLTSGEFTPSGSPGYIVVELVSDNSATTGSYSTFWDDLTIS